MGTDWRAYLFGRFIFLEQLLGQFLCLTEMQALQIR